MPQSKVEELKLGHYLERAQRDSLLVPARRIREAYDKLIAEPTDEIARKTAAETVASAAKEIRMAVIRMEDAL